MKVDSEIPLFIFTATWIGASFLFIAYYFLRKKTSIYDASTPITENTIVFPGDPIFEKHSVQSISHDCCFCLSKITLNNHMGTHIDFPAHIVPGGKTSSNYLIHDLIGMGVIIDARSVEKGISREFVQRQKIKKNDFVFFKTRNSNFSKEGSLVKNYVYIKPDAAEVPLEIGVRIVGIDYISVDALDAESLPTHQLFLKNGVLIIENLELNHTPSGRCEIMVSPLNIPNMDGLPARVIIKR